MIDNNNTTVQGTIDNAAQKNPQGKAEKKAGKRIGYHYIILKSLKESKKNDVVKCLYIKNLFDFGFCVIKEGTYGDTKDVHGRDIIDRLIWQRKLHEQLQHKVRVPRFLGSFEENGNYYLVIERIKGIPFYKKLKEDKVTLRKSLEEGSKIGLLFLDYLNQIVKIIEKLHKENIVHRDVTASNFIVMPGNKLAIIDLELSYSIQQQLPSPPFQLGTRGYMSPEQEATIIPTEKEDIFSLGALILQTWTNISPSKMTYHTTEDGLNRRISFFIQDLAIKELVFNCLHPNPLLRPATSDIQATLQQYAYDRKKNKPRSFSSYTPYSIQEVQETIGKGIATLGSSLLLDKKSGWFAENPNAGKQADASKINKVWYGSFSRGAAGVIYFLCQAQKAGFDINAAHNGIDIGLKMIEKKYRSGFDSSGAGLHFGSDGIAVTLAHLFDQQLIDASPENIQWITQLTERATEKLSMVDGISGQGIANILCSKYLPATTVETRLHNYVSILLNTQHKEGFWGNNNRKTKGFANGNAGIIYFLLDFSQKYNSPDALAGAQRGLEWLMKTSVHQADTINWQSTKGNRLKSWWCEGAVGISLAFLKAYKHLNLPEYKTYAAGALRNHPSTYLNSNLSQCHGMSGLGEVYLEAASILQDEEWYHRAEFVMQVIMNLKKEHPVYGTYWFVEKEKEPVSNFMVGNSGVLHFLLRSFKKEITNFPLLPA